MVDAPCKAEDSSDHFALSSRESHERLKAVLDKLKDR